MESSTFPARAEAALARGSALAAEAQAEDAEGWAAAVRGAAVTRATPAGAPGTAAIIVRGRGPRHVQPARKGAS
jgi:hypothetical protein